MILRFIFIAFTCLFEIKFCLWWNRKNLNQIQFKSDWSGSCRFVFICKFHNVDVLPKDCGPKHRIDLITFSLVSNKYLKVLSNYRTEKQKIIKCYLYNSNMFYSCRYSKLNALQFSFLIFVSNKEDWKF